jgi:hypothetical protein
MMIATVRGQFREFEGTITAAEDLAESRVAGKARVASIDTGQADRRSFLRNSRTRRRRSDGESALNCLASLARARIAGSRSAGRTAAGATAPSGLPGRAGASTQIGSTPRSAMSFSPRARSQFSRRAIPRQVCLGMPHATRFAAVGGMGASSSLHFDPVEAGARGDPAVQTLIGQLPFRQQWKATGNSVGTQQRASSRLAVCPKYTP